MSDQRDPAIEARAHELQAAGPDEYPFGYYYHLAEEEARDQKQEEVQRTEGEPLDLEVGYVYENEVLTIDTSLAGARIQLSLNYDDDDAGHSADLLLGAMPSVVAKVLDALDQEADRG